MDGIFYLFNDLVPNSWHVRPMKAVYDLDNIKLSTVPEGRVDADFRLENILIEAHSQEKNTYDPPRGLQFELGTPLQPAMTDTITMANLGYFQLKANPGTWEVVIRPGRGREIFKFLEAKDANQRDNSLISDYGARISLYDFDGVTLYPVVEKRPGMEEEDVLEVKPTDSGIWNSIKNSFKKKKGDTINVFSVASGHLYERFLSIMMISVKKQTKSNVKFWLIENFLSPSFMEFIPFLAEKHGFEYEYVTCKKFQCNRY
jgi:UDP-glucose:glycoprotein glucosyltransferase